MMEDEEVVSPPEPVPVPGAALDTAVFVFSLFDTGALLFLLVYYVSFVFTRSYSL